MRVPLRCASSRGRSTGRAGGFAAGARRWRSALGGLAAAASWLISCVPCARRRQCAQAAAHAQRAGQRRRQRTTLRPDAALRLVRRVTALSHALASPQG
eukprot:1200742-Alexandrium_andersonii.AAC.2